MDRKKEFNFDTLLGFFSIITAGAICILLLFCGYTQQDEQKALSSAEETLQFLKTSCLRCERYNVEGKRKILTHLKQSEETAKQYLTDEQIRNGDVLTDFCKKQNFTGMVVFDENFNIIGTSKDENHKVLAEVFDEKIFNDVVDHSDKYYMDFVDKNGLKFAYALSDSNGYAYLCYEKLSDEADDGLNLTLDSILDKYQFENEGIVLITQNGNTVYSNDQHMMIVSENEEPVSTIENTKYEENKFSILSSLSSTKRIFLPSRKVFLLSSLFFLFKAQSKLKRKSYCKRSSLSCFAYKVYASAHLLCKFLCNGQAKPCSVI